jgi:hypothetical protein
MNNSKTTTIYFYRLFYKLKYIFTCDFKLDLIVPVFKIIKKNSTINTHTNIYLFMNTILHIKSKFMLNIQLYLPNSIIKFKQVKASGIHAKATNP